MDKMRAKRLLVEYIATAFGPDRTLAQAVDVAVELVPIEVFRVLAGQEETDGDH